MDNVGEYRTRSVLAAWRRQTDSVKVSAEKGKNRAAI